MSPTGFMGLMVIASPFFGISEAIYKLLFNETNEAGFWFIFFVCFLIVLYAYPVLVFYRKEGRKKRAYRFAITLIILLFLTKSTAYVEAAIARNFTNPSLCKKSVSPDNLYQAEACYIKFNEVEEHFVARVFDAKTNTVIVEKEGSDATVKIWWDTNSSGSTTKLVVGGSGGGVIINLPPSFIDKLLAKLP